MNMKEAAARLAMIIKRLGGGTSVADQRELEALRDDMEAAAGAAAPKAQPRKRRAIAEERQPKPATEQPAAKAPKKTTATRKKASGK